MHRQEQHQLGKRAFSAYLFQTFGSKLLIHQFIQFPLTSAAQPVKQFEDLLEAWEEYKDSPEHQKAVQRSEKQQRGVKRLNQQVWDAKNNLERGRVLAFDVLQTRARFLDLSYEDQELVENFNCGKLAKTVESLLGRKAH